MTEQQQNDTQDDAQQPDDAQATTESTETPNDAQGDAQQSDEQPETKPTETVDYWKTRSRQNEDRAKANYDAAQKVPGLEQQITDLQSKLDAQPAAVATELRAHLIETHKIDTDLADKLITATDPQGVIDQVSTVIGLTGRSDDAQAPFAGSSASTPPPSEEAAFARSLFASGDE